MVDESSVIYALCPAGEDICLNSHRFVKAPTVNHIPFTPNCRLKILIGHFKITSPSFETIFAYERTWVFIPQFETITMTPLGRDEMELAILNKTIIKLKFYFSYENDSDDDDEEETEDMYVNVKNPIYVPIFKNNDMFSHPKFATGFRYYTTDNFAIELYRKWCSGNEKVATICTHEVCMDLPFNLKFMKFTKITDRELLIYKHLRLLHDFYIQVAFHQRAESLVSPTIFSFDKVYTIPYRCVYSNDNIPTYMSISTLCGEDVYLNFLNKRQLKVSTHKVTIRSDLIQIPKHATSFTINRYELKKIQEDDKDLRNVLFPNASMLARAALQSYRLTLVFNAVNFYFDEDAKITIYTQFNARYEIPKGSISFNLKRGSQILEDDIYIQFYKELGIPITTIFQISNAADKNIAPENAMFMELFQHHPWDLQADLQKCKPNGYTYGNMEFTDTVPLKKIT
jgi:hypothetical protein